MSFISSAFNNAREFSNQIAGNMETLDKVMTGGLFALSFHAIVKCCKERDPRKAFRWAAVAALSGSTIVGLVYQNWMQNTCNNPLTSDCCKSYPTIRLKFSAKLNYPHSQFNYSAQFI